MPANLSLEKYREKRDFDRTPEPPPGDPDAAARNLVFVVQQHDAYRAGRHWDFRLEVDGVLKSWPLRKPPPLNPAQKVGATMVEDHPYDYRNFEGVIPKGEYGGGHVIVWDEGIYTPDEDGVTSWNDKEEGSRRMREGLEAGKISFTLQGKKLRGSFALIKTRYRPNSWLLIKHRDEYVSERDLLEDNHSVRSGLTTDDLKEGRLPNPATTGAERLATARAAPFPDPKKERPMMATLIDEAFDTKGWFWEPKLDGVRTLAFIRDGKVELRSRRGNDATKQYPAVVEALATLSKRALVLDGEICALDENGMPRFQLLQSRINLTRSADIARIEAEVPAVFFVFDMIYLDGYDLHAVPLRDRKELLQANVPVRDNIRLVSHFEDKGSEIASAAKDLGFEGVVGKRTDSRYEPGVRSKAWVKVKTVREQEFVVGGYTPGEGARSTSFGALALGYYDDGKLRYAGNVGSGFNDGQLSTVLEVLDELKTDRSPFAEKVEGHMTWTRPEMVAQVKYGEWTNDRRLRAPVFLGLRNDVDPLQVRRETPASAAAIESASTTTSSASTKGSDPISEVEAVLRQLENPKGNFNVELERESIKLTNLDKEFWPEYEGRPPLSKRELVKYYVKVAPVLLPHLKDRPLTLTRYPNGVMAKPFYQKHYDQPIPSFVDTLMIWSEHTASDGEYIVCNNLPTLVWLAQLADLELHAWMARVDPEPDAHGTTRDFAGSERALETSALNYPDFMVFDLDPYIYSGREGQGEEPEYNKRGWEKTVEIALSLKDLLDQLRLSSFVKTTGKTGIHIYVPLLRHYDYDTVRAATQTLGRFLIQQHPKDVTMEWDTSKRRGKVFFDANQNTRGKTLAAQYSLRPTAWAGVSVPVTWSELASVDPVSFNILNAPERIAKVGDVWADILSRKNDLGPLLSG